MPNMKMVIEKNNDIKLNSDSKSESNIDSNTLYNIDSNIKSGGHRF